MNGNCRGKTIVK